MHEYTIWRVVDSHWVNVYRELNNKPADRLCDMLITYLWRFGFDIPDTIKYCLAEDDNHKLKFRVHGSAIHIHISVND